MSSCLLLLQPLEWLQYCFTIFTIETCQEKYYKCCQSNILHFVPSSTCMYIERCFISDGKQQYATPAPFYILYPLTDEWDSPLYSKRESTVWQCVLKLSSALATAEIRQWNGCTLKCREQKFILQICLTL